MSVAWLDVTWVRVLMVSLGFWRRCIKRCPTLHGNPREDNNNRCYSLLDAWRKYKKFQVLVCYDAFLEVMHRKYMADTNRQDEERKKKRQDQYPLGMVKTR